MSPTIEHIESAGPNRRARRLVFSDGSEPRLTSAAVVRDTGVAEGTTIAPQDLEAALAEAEARLARERLLRLLATRDRSRLELDRRLREDGYPDPIRSDLLDRFEQVGLVDDARFATGWARTRVLAGYGIRRITCELVEKGIDRELIARALDETTEGDEVERARAVLRGRSPGSVKERDRLVRKLVSRGFDIRVALAAIDTDIAETPAE